MFNLPHPKIVRQKSSTRAISKPYQCQFCGQNIQTKLGSANLTQNDWNDLFRETNPKVRALILLTCEDEACQTLKTLNR